MESSNIRSDRSDIFQKEEGFLKNNLDQYRCDGTYVFGRYEGDVEQLIKEFMAVNTSCFVKSVAHSKEKNHKRYSKTASPIWEHKGGNIPIQFFGSPFEIIGSESRHCLHGTLKDTRGSWKHEKSSEHDYSGPKTRIILQSTRKLNCPAEIQIRTVKVYFNYSVELKDCKSERMARTRKEKMISTLKGDLDKGEKPEFKICHFVRFPLLNTHKGHPLCDNARIHQMVDSQIIAKVDDLVSKNITNTSEVKRFLQEYVKKELFEHASEEEMPNPTNRKFYPTKKDLQNHIARSIFAMKTCKDDQEALRRKIETWQKDSPETKFYYRPCSPADEVKQPKQSQKVTFLFVHQEPWQQRLLARYGSKLVLMDATYKATKYALPLFFICVNTNSSYKVIAEFITQYEDHQSISEALAILKSWNPNWSPLSWMLDYSGVEISAVEEQFPKSVAYICDFHRLQAWQRWVRKSKNGLSQNEQEELMHYLKKIADAKTKEDYEDAVEELRDLPLYDEKENVQKYIENTWLSCSFRWARAFRIHEVDQVVNTNNGVEAQNRLLKYNYLPYSIDKSVYGIATMLVESFIPEAYTSYCNMNMKLSDKYRSYNAMVPKYLHNRPPIFIKHCLKSQFAAEEFRDSDILCQDAQQGIFQVRSSSEYGKYHTVLFYIPSCTCESFQRSHYPCKHFYAVFNYYEEWCFENLPSAYQNSPFLTLDSEIVDMKQPTMDSGMTSTDGNEGKPEGERQQKSEETKEDEKHNEEEFKEEGDVEEEESGIGLEQEMQQEEQRTIRHDMRQSSDLQIGTLQKQLREESKEIIDISYLVDNKDAINEALKKLEDVHEDLRKHTQLESGISLRLSPQKRKLKLSSTDYHKVFYKKLQRRKKYKRQDKNKQSIVIDLTNCGDETQNGTNAVNHQKANRKIKTSSTETAPKGTTKAVKRLPRISNTPNVSEPFQRIRLASQWKIKTNDTMLKFGPYNVTPGDIWTLMPIQSLQPQDYQMLATSLSRSFIPGWLVDSVIDSYFWKQQLQSKDVFSVSTTFFTWLKNGGRTRRAWPGEKFTEVQFILVPMNISDNHWTLLVLNKQQKTKLYFDPMVSIEREITEATHKKLWSYIQMICKTLDFKTSWCSTSWSCREPMHYCQKDSYNCGVLVCLFARCLIDRMDLNSNFNLVVERERLASAIFGSCYNDMERRDVGVCKICHLGTGGEWLGCDACGQFFHAACINVDYYFALAEPTFLCPQ